jgi:hypothetical protein
MTLQILDDQKKNEHTSDSSFDELLLNVVGNLVRRFTHDR